MKKHIILLLLSVCSLSTLFAQGLKKGYFILNDGTTVETYIKLTGNKISYIKYQKGVKSKKIRKSKLTDFGNIIDGQKKSKYAEHAFSKKAYKAYYIDSNTKDTIPFFLAESSQGYIDGYNLDKTDLNLLPEDTEMVVAQMHSKTITFDVVNIRFKKKRTKTFFLERKSGSTINMYTITVKKRELQDLDEPYYMYFDSMNPIRRSGKEVVTKYYFFHLLVKGDRKLLLAFGTKDQTSKLEVRSYINDCAFINSKLGTKGYQIEEDLFTIIETYNQHSNDNECN